MRKLTEIDESKLGSNIFVNKLTIDVTKVYNHNKHKPSKSGVMLPETHFIDRTPNTKLFHAQGIKDSVYGLDNPSKSLLLFILLNLQSGKDYIRINRQHFMNKHGIKSENTYRAALKDLCLKEFIYPTIPYPKEVFWINPSLFFCGNRTTKYPDNLVVKSEISL